MTKCLSHSLFSSYLNDTISHFSHCPSGSFPSPISHYALKFAAESQEYRQKSLESIEDFISCSRDDGDHKHVALLGKVKNHYLKNCLKKPVPFYFLAI